MNRQVSSLKKCKFASVPILLPLLVQTLAFHSLGCRELLNIPEPHNMTEPTEESVSRVVVGGGG